jgi:hypothetical protein
MIIYPDLEVALVSYLKSVLDNSVYVSVKAAPADVDPKPVAQVIVNVAPSAQQTPVTRFANVLLECMALSYENANELGLVVEAWLREATSTGHIKSVRILVGPTRIADESVYEKRNISAEVVVKAVSL